MNSETKNTSWREEFDTDYSQHPEEIVKFVKWYIALLKSRKEANAGLKQVLDSMEPALITFAGCFATFLFSIDGDFDRIGELEIRETTKPIVKLKN